IGNLGKYNEGELVGEWVRFPITAEELSKVFERIGIDGKEYEEWHICDYEVENSTLYALLGEYESLDELNYLAIRLDDLKEYERDIFYAALEIESCNGIQEVIHVLDSLDQYEVMRSVHDDYDLGHYYIEESGIYDLSSMGNLGGYIDYERFGRDIRMEEYGDYTDYGYVRSEGNLDRRYMGIADIPEEYLIRNRDTQKQMKTSKSKAFER
ncbi:antirestriction protein ArdA, partial [Eubacteriales bacterium OttesenSCG-928-N14]|nr:antirestriction protein ArdA [Eubacteriales bacterium OttesenSCG-928-N14]